MSLKDVFQLHTLDYVEDDQLLSQRKELKDSEMKRIYQVLAISGVMLLGFSGCAGNAVRNGESEEAAVVLKVLTSEFWQDVKAGSETEAKNSGLGIKFFAANAEEDVEGQVNLVENAVTQGYKALGVAPISNVNLNASLAQASQQGTYIVNIDEPVDLNDLEARGGAVQLCLSLIHI